MQCPNCGAAVPPAADRCPVCGMPRALMPSSAQSPTPPPLPGFAPPGDYAPTPGYTPPPGYGPGGGAGFRPDAPAAMGPPPPPPLPPTPHRNPLPIIVGILGIALVLGIAVALVVTFVVLPGRRTGTPSAPGSVSGPPSPGASTDAPTPPDSTSPGSSPPSAAPDYPAAAAKVASGVVAVLASTCQSDRASAGQGAGVLLADGTVLTAWPAVSQAVAVAVKIGTVVIPATVLGVDRAAGLARLKLSRAAPASAHRFTLAPASFADATAALIVPDPSQLEGPKLVTAPVGAGGSGKFGGQTYALPTVGLDGAPIGGFPRIDGNGALAGMVIGLPSGQWLLAGRAQLAGGMAVASGADHGTCTRALGPGLMLMDVASGAMKAPFEAYFSAINTGDYATAYAQLHNPKQSLATSQTGWYSTYDFAIVVHRNDGATAWVEFVSIFKAGLGPSAKLTCAHWSLDYTIVGGRIGQVKGHNGGALYRSC